MITADKNHKMDLLVGALSGPLKAWFASSSAPLGGCATGAALDDCGSASIVYDDYGVATVSASNEGDQWYLMGVVHAYDRLWQMHAARSLARGRISEFAGAKGVPLDALARQIGWARLGQEDWADRASWDDAAAVFALERYAAGVTWGAGRASLPAEFAATGASFYEWTAEDTLCVIRVHSFVMNFGFQASLVREALVDVFGAEASAWTATAEREPGIPFAAPSEGRAAREAALASPAGAGAATLAPDAGTGSNWWAVAGSKTASGKPILAGDPHLRMTLPCFWYEIVLDGPLKARGCGPPGLPALFVATNGVWCSSVTLGYCDVEDVWLERLDGKGGYADGKGASATLTRDATETIRVKGGADVEVRCQSTRRGAAEPAVLGDAALQRLAPYAGGGATAAAYYSIGMRPRSRAAKGLRDMLLAKDFAQFDAALSHCGICNLNIGYADVNGHIGSVLTGPPPTRSVERGREQRPLHGWEGHAWTGYVPWDAMPKVLDPPCGYIISANHKIVDYAEYPEYLGDVWKSGFRAKSVETALLAAFDAGPVTTGAMRELQSDVTSLAAARFGRAVVGADVGDDLASDLARFRDWSGSLDVDSTTASLYQVLHARLLVRLFEAGAARVGASEKGVRPLVDLAMGAAFDVATTVKIQNALSGHVHLNLLRLLEAPGNWWVDAAGGLDALVASCLAEAVAELAALAPAGEHWSDARECAWGALHVKELTHTLSAAAGVPTPLDLAPFSCGGDTNTINQNACASYRDLAVGAGSQPSLRVVWDLADVRGGSEILVAPGQSGQFQSPHYGDQMCLWKDGRLRPLAPPPAASDSADRTTTFAPPSDEPAASWPAAACPLM